MAGTNVTWRSVLSDMRRFSLLHAACRARLYIIAQPWSRRPEHASNVIYGQGFGRTLRAAFAYLAADITSSSYYDPSRRWARESLRKPRPNRSPRGSGVSSWPYTRKCTRHGGRKGVRRRFPVWGRLPCGRARRREEAIVLEYMAARDRAATPPVCHRCGTTHRHPWVRSAAAQRVQDVFSRLRWSAELDHDFDFTTKRHYYRLPASRP